MQMIQPNKCRREFELVIIGGGCSGLSLALALCRLADKPDLVPSTLIIEPRPCYTNDRSWCYWEKEDKKNSNLVKKKWQAWEFSSNSISYRQASKRGWKYHYVPAITFYNSAERNISLNPNLTLLKDSRVADVNPQDNHIEILIESCSVDNNIKTEKVAAKQIVDTRIPDDVDLSSAVLKQIFFGFEVVMNKSHRFPDVARVMENMRVDDKGFVFDYVLPIDSNSILVEFTRFAEKSLSPESLRKDAMESLRRVCGGSGYNIVREEYGMIPMGLRGKLKPKDARWIHTGLGAGAARPSTGYAFKRIQHWADRCAERILEGRNAHGFLPDNSLLMWMDKVFLRAIANNPAIAPQLFLSLARKVSPESLLRFLTDQPTMRDLFAIVLALPKLALFHSALAQIYHEIRAINWSHA
jgi:lycopene beta-cyclase